MFGPPDPIRKFNHHIMQYLLNPIEFSTVVQWLPTCAVGIGQIAICLPMLGPGILRYIHRLLVRVWGSKIEPAPSSDGPGPIPNAAKKRQKDTLGSVNTQNLEAYAMGRIQGDEERGMTVSSVSKDVSIETVTAQS